MIRLNVPNLLTVSRILLVPVFGWLLFADAGPGILLFVFALAAVSDWLDGFAARRLGQVTPSGAVLDQMIDRAFTVLIVALLVVDAWLEPSRSDLAADPAHDTVLLLALACTREIVALPGVAIVLVRGKRLYHVEFVGKVATFVQSVTLGVIIAVPAWALPVAAICAGVGVVAAASYVRYALR